MHTGYHSQMYVGNETRPYDGPEAHTPMTVPFLGDGGQMPNNRCSNCIAYNLDCTYVEAAKVSLRRAPPLPHRSITAIRNVGHQRGESTAHSDASDRF